MEDRHAINDMYYCGRLRPSAIISVLTGNSYVVAEYDERSGNIRWQRVVNATQREGIHHWLRDHFPVKVAQLPVALPAAKSAHKSLKNKANKPVVAKSKAARPATKAGRVVSATKAKTKAKVVKASASKSKKIVVARRANKPISRITKATSRVAARGRKALKARAA